MKFYRKFEIKQNYVDKFEVYVIHITKTLFNTDKSFAKIVDKDKEDYDTIEEAKERIKRYNFKKITVWQSEEQEV